MAKVEVPTGYRLTPAPLAADMRALLKRHGVKAAAAACGLNRGAVLAVAAETIVQAGTLEAAREGIRRILEAEGIPA
jgi:hypothetical protein